MEIEVLIVCVRPPLFSVQCERTLGQRIHVIYVVRESLSTSSLSFNAALFTPRGWISYVANFNLAVEEDLRVFADILEGFQTKTLSLRVWVGMEP